MFFPLGFRVCVFWVFSFFPPCGPCIILSTWHSKNETCNYVAGHRHHELSKANRDERRVAKWKPQITFLDDVQVDIEV